MSQKITIKQSSVTLTILKSIILLAWRFHLGQPLNGKRRDNSTFLKGATRGAPGKVLTRWQKKPQMHRGLIRVGVFYPIVGIIVLFIVARTFALLVLAFSAFPLGLLAYRKGRLIFFDPFASTDAGNGARTQHWMLKNKWRRLFRLQPVPGLVTKKTRQDPNFPVEVEDAIKAELNMGILKGFWPVTKVTRIPLPKGQRYKRGGKTRSDR